MSATGASPHQAANRPDHRAIQQDAQQATRQDAAYGAPDVSAGPDPVVSGEPVEVAEGVHVIPDGRVELVPNIGIVVGERAALVIDTGMGPANGAHVLEQARALAGDLPLHLTLTHFHPEHGYGAQAFKGEATIVYNRAQRDELRRKGAGYLDMFRGLGPRIADRLDGVTLVEPDIVHDGEAEIDLGGRRALLRAVGPAHTGSDQIVLVDGHVLFGGDLVETRIFPITPYFPPHDTDVDPHRWIRVLGELLALEPGIVVPGHGEVTGASLLREVREFLCHVRDEAARLKAAGVGAREAAETIGREARARWSTWERPEWITGAAHAFRDSPAA